MYDLLISHWIYFFFLLFEVSFSVASWFIFSNFHSLLWLCRKSIKILLESNGQSTILVKLPPPRRNTIILIFQLIEIKVFNPHHIVFFLSEKPLVICGKHRILISAKHVLILKMSWYNQLKLWFLWNSNRILNLTQLKSVSNCFLEQL